VKWSSILKPPVCSRKQESTSHFVIRGDRGWGSDVPDFGDKAHLGWHKGILHLCTNTQALLWQALFRCAVVNWQTIHAGERAMHHTHHPSVFVKNSQMAFGDPDKSAVYAAQTQAPKTCLKTLNVYCHLPKTQEHRFLHVSLISSRLLIPCMDSKSQLHFVGSESHPE
jgi:hypothetical protein